MSSLQFDYPDNVAPADKGNGELGWSSLEGAGHTHIRRNDPWASPGRTPVLVTLRCALPEDTSAPDPHRYLHISPHAVCRLHLSILSSFLFIKPWISPLLWMTYFPISNFVQLIFLKSHGLQFYKKRTSTGRNHICFFWSGFDLILRLENQPLKSH